jgi:hypothetical protein
VNFQEMKRRHLAEGGKRELDRLRSPRRHNLNRHKKRKLAQIERGKDTLLADDVHQVHARRLYTLFAKRWGYMSKAEEQKRLRFVTVLHDAAPCNVEDIDTSISNMRERLEITLKRVKGIHFVGAVEVEIVNLPVLRQIADRNDENEHRKLLILEEMSLRYEETLYRDDSVALVHVHGIADLGPWVDKEGREKWLARVLRSEWEGEYRVEVKQTFSNYKNGREIRIRTNLEKIANYMVKGGNEDLRYSARFGRATLEDGSPLQADELDHKMKKGAGNARYNENASVEDTRSLTIHEIQVLVSVIDRLMGKGKREGYLIKHGKFRRR